MATQNYPRCAPSPDLRQLCDDGNDLVAPAHTVTSSYRYGVPSHVASTLGPWADYSYHPNLQRCASSTPPASSATSPRAPRACSGRSGSATSTAPPSTTRADGNRWVDIEPQSYDAADNMVSYRRDAEPVFPLNPSGATNRILGNDDIFYDGAGNIVQVGLAPDFTMSYDAFDMQSELDLQAGVNNQYLYA